MIIPAPPLSKKTLVLGGLLILVAIAVGVILALVIQTQIGKKPGPTVVKKDEYSTTTKNTDSTYTTKISALPIHYKNKPSDEKEEWKDIDTTIKSARNPEYNWEMTKAPYKAYFKNNPKGEKAILIEKDGHKFAYSLTGFRTYKNGAKSKLIPFESDQPQVNSNQILWQDNQGNEFKITLTPQGPKEEWKFSKNPSPTKDFNQFAIEFEFLKDSLSDLSFFINEKPWTGSQTTIAGWNLFELRDKSGKSVFTWSSVVILDLGKKGPFNESNGTYLLSQTGDIINLSTMIPGHLLKEAKYPVSVDPSFSIGPSTMVLMRPRSINWCHDHATEVCHVSPPYSAPAAYPPETMPNFSWDYDIATFQGAALVSKGQVGQVYAYQLSGASAKEHFNARTYFTFDTRSLPDDATINNASVNFETISQDAASGQRITWIGAQTVLQLRDYDWGGIVEPGDWVNGDATAPYDGGYTIFSGPDAPNSLTIPLSNMGWIRKTDFTKYMMVESREWINSTPFGSYPTGWAGSGNAQIYTFRENLTMSVTYSAPSGTPTPGPTATPTPIPGSLTVNYICPTGSNRASLSWSSKPGYSGDYDVEVDSPWADWTRLGSTSGTTWPQPVNDNTDYGWRIRTGASVWAGPVYKNSDDPCAAPPGPGLSVTFICPDGVNIKATLSWSTGTSEIFQWSGAGSGGGWQRFNASSSTSPIVGPDAVYGNMYSYSDYSFRRAYDNDPATNMLTSQNSGNPCPAPTPAPTPVGACTYNDSNYPTDTFGVCFWDGMTGAGGGPFLGQTTEGDGSNQANYTAFDHDWGAGEIWVGSLHTGRWNTVSGTWRGNINFSPGNYRFWVTTDDGVYLWAGGGWRIIEWHDGSNTYSSSWIGLNGYNYIRLDWYENTGNARIKLWWEKEAPTPTPAAQPDLTIINASLDKTDVPSGETITATLTIKNQGTGSTVNPFWSDFYKSRSSLPPCDTSGDTIIGGGQLGPLAAGASLGPFSVPFVAPSSPGSYTAYAFTDSFCDIPESNETNNIIPFSYTVSAAPIDCPEEFEALQPRGSTSDSAPYFSWSPPISIPVNSYELQMNTTGNFDTSAGGWYWYATPSPPNNPGMSYPASWSSTAGAPPPPNGQLQTEGTYYWRVLADNGCVAGATISDHENGIPEQSTDPLGPAYDPFGPYPAIFTYIGTPAWFKTEKNNIGAKNAMSLQSLPPDFQTSFTAISGTAMTNIISQSNWLVRGYGNWSVPRSSFAYFWSKKGSPTPPAISYPLNGIYYNSTDLSLSGSLSISGPSVIFVDGNLSITGNLTFSGSYGVVFIVKGNIIVAPGVILINGFYLANGNFSDGVGSSQLVVNGAVVAHGNLPATTGVSLQRDLGAVANATTPAEKIIFQPRYLVDFADLLGAPSYTWHEVAP